MEIELTGEAERPPIHDHVSAHTSVSSALMSGKVLIAMADPVRIEKIRKILSDDHLREAVVAPAEAVAAVRSDPPSMVVLEHDGGDAAAAILREIRAEMPDVPI